MIKEILDTDFDVTPLVTNANFHTVQEGVTITPKFKAKTFTLKFTKISNITGMTVKQG